MRKKPISTYLFAKLIFFESGDRRMKFLLASVVCIFSQISFAQTTGSFKEIKIIDQANKQPIVGASACIDNMQLVILSLATGRFSQTSSGAEWASIQIITLAMHMC